MKNLLRLQPIHTNGAVLLLRLIFGGLFMRYGYMKFENFDQITTMFPDYLGIGAKGNLALVVFAELVCGFFVLIGFLTRFSVIPVFITMVVAYFAAHAKDAFDQKAIVLLLMILSVVIFILGSGKYSVDKLLFKNRHDNINKHVL
jgi:putative oxidoreductase